MESGVFGRTNLTLPNTWLRLVGPYDDVASLVNAAVAANTVIDISTNPALWGAHMRGTNARLMTVGPVGLSLANDSQQAHDFLLAHLVETLSSIGREYIDFYYLKVDADLNNAQIEGALAALEDARQQNNIRFSGIAPTIKSAVNVLRDHDAFEAMLIDSTNHSLNEFVELAKSRRMGIVRRSAVPEGRTSKEATLINVSAASEVETLFDRRVRV